jgi:hypothetical protein
VDNLQSLKRETGKDFKGDWYIVQNGRVIGFDNINKDSAVRVYG